MADVDFVAAEHCFAPDALWHLPGRSPIAGEHRGWAQIRDDFLSKSGPLSGGTFRAELFDVAVGDTYVVAVQRATASRGERTLDVTGCQLIRVSNGIIHNVRATTPIRLLSTPSGPSKPSLRSTANETPGWRALTAANPAQNRAGPRRTSCVSQEGYRSRDVPRTPDHNWC